jgi:hypothetical protein
MNDLNWMEFRQLVPAEVKTALVLDTLRKWEMAGFN